MKHDLISIFKKKSSQQVFAVIFVIFVVFSLIFSAITPLEYRSTSKILISPRFGRNTDIYSATRFTEYLSNLLREVIYSKVFFDEVMSAGFVIDKTFSTNDLKRSKQWKKAVDVRVLSDTGILKIDVYDTNKEQAQKISRGIATVLLTKGDQFHGAGNQVVLRVIDGPVLNDHFVRPNILLNLGVGIFFGLISGVFVIFLFPSVDLSKISLRKRREVVMPVIPVEHYGQPIKPVVNNVPSNLPVVDRE